jgi:hypothetical protein
VSRRTRQPDVPFHDGGIRAPEARRSDKYPGLEVVNVGQPVGTPRAVILEQLERFSAQVMPAFKSK